MSRLKISQHRVIFVWPGLTERTSCMNVYKIYGSSWLGAQTQRLVQGLILVSFPCCFAFIDLDVPTQQLLGLKLTVVPVEHH